LIETNGIVDEANPTPCSDLGDSKLNCPKIAEIDKFIYRVNWIRLPSVCILCMSVCRPNSRFVHNPLHDRDVDNYIGARNILTGPV